MSKVVNAIFFFRVINVLVLAVLLQQHCYAQFQLNAPPAGINYQAIARDTSGHVMSNYGNLNVTFSIWDTIASGVGNVLFTETHDSVKTNQYGLFTLVIGSENPQGLDTLYWFYGKKFLEIYIDSAGVNGVTLPRTQLMSVPYALHSKTAFYSIANWALDGNTTDASHFIGTKNAQDFVFKTNNNERMRINSTGKIGIGTANPTAPLTIQNMNTAGNEIEFLSSGNSADIHANSQLNIGATSTVNFLTAGSTKLHIANNGYVGIGTLSPTASLELAGQIKINGGSPGLGKILTSDAAGLGSWQNANQLFSAGTGITFSGNLINSVWTTSGANIHNNNTGNVGTGTTTPDTELEVVSTSSSLPRGLTVTQYHSDYNRDAQLWLRKARGTETTPQAVSDGDELGFIKFRGYDSSNGFHTSDQTEIGAVAAENFSSAGNGSYLKFSTTPIGSVYGSERMRINHNGNIGINTTNPSSKLDVDGTLTISGNSSNEINRTQTGAANLLPIAYGSVSANGTINTGTGNFTVVWVGGFDSEYEITIAGESYNSNGYITLVTPIGDNVKPTAKSASGKLIVQVFNPGNAAIQSAFQFIVYKP
ncbi:MAG: hypothetical protein WBM13_15405 [Bacteroidia bacterium]